MEPDHTPNDDADRPTISSAQVGSPLARQRPDEDLARFAVGWSRQLEEATTSEERVRVHQIGGEVAERSTKAGEPSASDFARTWLRRLADDIHRDHLGEPLPAILVSAAQRVIRGELQYERDNLAFLEEAVSAGRDPMEFVRRFPRATGSLRDLGRLAAAFRGSGILSHENPELVSVLVGFDEALRGRSRRTLTTVPDSMRVSREELLRWADSGTGHDFPGLVRHLVSETAEGLERVHFPTGVGASAGDWDGVVYAAVGDAFVPEGLSVWELSVNKKSNDKAEDDYAKRLTAPEGSSTSRVTYVEVICRPWVKAGLFASTHRAEHRWRDIRAYNVDDLETWLEHAPATTVWLAEKIGRPIAGLLTAEQWWASWLASTRTPLRSEIVLAGRDAQAKQLRERVVTAGSPLLAAMCALTR